MSGIRSPNLPLGTTLGEFVGNEIVGSSVSLKRFSRASVIGPLEAIASGAQAGGGIAFSSKAQADANLGWSAFQLALVTSDATPALNGIYQKLGATGVGSWLRIADLPNEVVQLTVSGGTANAITATMLPQVPTQPYGKFYILTPTAGNTAAVTVNGAAVVNALGSSLIGGELVDGSPVVMIWTGARYQLLISLPADTAGVVADAVAARNAASGYATSASGYATAAASSASALGNQVHQYDTRALAIAATIPSGVNLVRVLGYTSAGDGGGALYKKVGSAPSHSGKFQSADGAWWEFVVEGALDIRQFGGGGNGVTTNDAAFDAAWSVLVAAGAGGEITFPGGKFKFASPVAKTLPNSQFAIMVSGAGSNATTLYWPNASGGIAYTAQHTRNTFHFRDFSITTSQIGSGNALDMTGIGANSGQYFQSDIVNVQVHGDDIGPSITSEYWAIGIRLHNWGSINIDNTNTHGPHSAPGAAGGGRGLVYEGDAATGSYATILNVTNSSFNFHIYGAELGDYWQGVTFNQCNFNGRSGAAGIHQISGTSGVQVLLTVVDCQVDYGGAVQINLEGPVINATFDDNTISVYDNGHIGLSMVGGQTLLASGNVINVSNAATGTFGIAYSGTGGVFTGNQFASLGTAINLQAGSSSVKVSNNSYISVTTHVVNNGTGNSVGVASD